MRINIRMESFTCTGVSRFPKHRTYSSEFFVADVTPETHFFKVPQGIVGAGIGFADCTAQANNKLQAHNNDRDKNQPS
jgi:hypothetical protein